MREILFRGKLKTDNGEYKKGDWVYGDFVTLIDGKEKHPHIYGKGEVKAETIGQYTGLTDKNGTKIFENGYFVIDEQTYKVVFDNAQYILTNIFSCDIILLKDNSNKGVFIDEI